MMRVIISAFFTVFLLFSLYLVTAFAKNIPPPPTSGAVAINVSDNNTGLPIAGSIVHAFELKSQVGQLCSSCHKTQNVPARLWDGKYEHVNFEGYATDSSGYIRLFFLVPAKVYFHVKSLDGSYLSEYLGPISVTKPITYSLDVALEPLI